MRRTCSNGLKLDLTENTPGSSSTSRLPNLVEHAENCQIPSGCPGENLSSKLPNVVEGSMDYGSERRSSRYLEYDPSKSYQDGQGTGNYGDADASYVDRGYSTRTLDRKIPYDRENLERYDNRIYPEENLRFERRVEPRTYQESDLDAPYERTDAAKLRNYPLDHQDPRRYSRDVTDYEYTARYQAEETLKLEPKKDHRHQGKLYEVPASKGYESGVKTHDSSYELGSCAAQEYSARKYDTKYDNQYDSKYHSLGKMYGTLPRYEATTGKSYDAAGDRSFEPTQKYDAYDTGVKMYDSSKYELTSSKSYERTKHESTSRYQDSSKSYEQTLKIGEVGSSSSTPYTRKQNSERNEANSEKINGYRKNNFEAYGVYSDPEDDHGFLTDKKTPQYTYKGVVVNVSGESSVVEQKRTKEATQTEVQTSPWCKPTILLLLLVLLVVIFVLVAGILLYFNCK